MSNICVLSFKSLEHGPSAGTREAMSGGRGNTRPPSRPGKVSVPMHSGFYLDQLEGRR